jgi:hypothetical protein
MSEPLDTIAISFLLEADISPGLLPRLLQPFAKRNLVPDHLRSECGSMTMQVEIIMLAVPVAMVPVIEGNLRQVIGVRHITRR